VLSHYLFLGAMYKLSYLLIYLGGTDEYGLMVEEMMSEYPDNKFIAVGFSMGANIVVKYLGEHEQVQSQFLGAISCCQGYDVVE